MLIKQICARVVCLEEKFASQGFILATGRCASIASLCYRHRQVEAPVEETSPAILLHSRLFQSGHLRLL
jgi:hypothetical protein